VVVKLPAFRYISWTKASCFPSNSPETREWSSKLGLSFWSPGWLLLYTRSVSGV